MGDGKWLITSLSTHRKQKGKVRGRTGSRVRLYTLKAHPQWCVSSSNAVPPKVSMTPQRVAPTRDEVLKYTNLWRTFLIQSTSRKQKASGKHSALWERIPSNWHFETREMSPDCQPGVNCERSRGVSVKEGHCGALSSWDLSEDDNRKDPWMGFWKQKQTAGWGYAHLPCTFVVRPNVAKRKKSCKLGVVEYAYNPSTWAGKAVGSWVQVLPWLHNALLTDMACTHNTSPSYKTKLRINMLQYLCINKFLPESYH